MTSQILIFCACGFCLLITINIAIGFWLRYRSKSYPVAGEEEER
jgi:hypothetical protein